MLLDRDRHVAQHGRTARAGDREQVREAGDLQAEIVARPGLPYILQGDAVASADVDAQQRAGHGVEAGGEDDDVDADTPRLACECPFGVMRSMGAALTSTSATLGRLKVSK